MPDSLSNILRHTQYAIAGVDIPPAVLESFSISFIVLLAAAIVKYTIAKNSNIVDWGEMALELPIDICAIIATIIASTHIPVEANLTLYSLSAFLPILLCGYFRRRTLQYYINRSYWAILFVCLDYGTAFVWIKIIVNLIFKNYVG